MWQRVRQFGKIRTARLLVPTVAVAALLSLAIYSYGWPIDGYTWVVLALSLVCGVLPGAFNYRLSWAAVAVVFSFYIAFPAPFLQFIPFLERWHLCDDHGGRSGLEISPGLRFGRDGANTALLESYLGPLPPNWWCQSPNFPHIRDGNERVQSRNPILQDYLPEILARLPDEEARRQVRDCLVDTENRLRVHQGLLLACLMEMGYPPGLDAESWWDAHCDLFRSQHDPALAAGMTRGWMRRIERLPILPWGAVSSLHRAARYQEQGDWGGHPDFGEEVTTLEWNHKPAEIDASKNVVWWPSASEEMFGTAVATDAFLIRSSADGSKVVRTPLYFLYSSGNGSSEDSFVHTFNALYLEPNPRQWSTFGMFEFKVDGKVTYVPILQVNRDELAVKVGNQTFRGLNKSEVLEMFRKERTPLIGASTFELMKRPRSQAEVVP